MGNLCRSKPAFKYAIEVLIERARGEIARPVVILAIGIRKKVATQCGQPRHGLTKIDALGFMNCTEVVPERAPLHFHIEGWVTIDL